MNLVYFLASLISKTDVINNCIVLFYRIVYEERIYTMRVHILQTFDIGTITITTLQALLFAQDKHRRFIFYYIYYCTNNASAI